MQNKKCNLFFTGINGDPETDIQIKYINSVAKLNNWATMILVQKN